MNVVAGGQLRGVDNGTEDLRWTDELLTKFEPITG